MIRSNGKSRTVLAALSVALILASGVADARMGRGSSFGSRGVRTWSAPAVTRTAPATSQPIQRSVTPGQPGTFQTAPSFGQPSRGGIFGRPGFMGGLFGGLLGAGLLGMLFGGSFFGGLTGGGSMLGLLLQLALVFFIARWALRAFSGRTQAASAGGPSLRNAFGDGDPRGNATGFGMGSLPGLGSGSRSSGNPDELGIGQDDLDRFEQLLRDVQAAYGREDLATLRQHTTPEMLSYLSEELTDNASRGVINRVSDIKLLSGDVAESWREGETEYVTAAMRYSLTDITEDRKSGTVVESGPGEATELWTFRRAAGGDWLLSAIQQA